MDEYAVRRKLTPGCLMVLAIAVSIVALRSNNPLISSVVLMVPIGIFFLSRPVLTAMLAPMAYYSKLMIPNLPGSFLVAYMLMLIAIARWMGSTALQGSKRRKYNATDIFVFIFILIMFLHMLVRGFGFRLMGEMQYGGTGYIYMLLWFGFYFAASKLELTEKQVRRMLPGLFLSALIAVCFLAIVYLRPSWYGVISRFSTVSFDYIVGAIQTGDIGKGRWGEAGVMGELLTCLALIAPFRKRVALKRGALLGLALVAVLLSGFRSTFVYVVIITLAWTVVNSRARIITVMKIAVLSLILWGGAVVTIDYLPENIQRTLTVLPGVRLHSEMARQATGTVDWRLEVWAYAVTRIPEYLWIGRGLITDVTSAAWMQSNYYVSPEFAYLVGNYHSGPLSLLLTYGLFGFLAYFGFIIAQLAASIRTLRRYRVYRNLYAYTFLRFSAMMLVLSMLFYLFANGGPLPSLPAFVVWILLSGWCIKLLNQHDHNLKAERKE